MSPILPPMRINAADTSASSAIVDCRPLTVTPVSLTTAEIDTFMIEVSTTNTNIAIESNNASLPLKGFVWVPLSREFIGTAFRWGVDGKYTPTR